MSSRARSLAIAGRGSDGAADRFRHPSPSALITPAAADVGFPVRKSAVAMLVVLRFKYADCVYPHGDYVDRLAKHKRLRQSSAWGCMARRRCAAKVASTSQRGRDLRQHAACSHWWKQHQTATSITIGLSSTSAAYDNGNPRTASALRKHERSCQEVLGRIILLHRRVWVQYTLNTTDFPRSKTCAIRQPQLVVLTTHEKPVPAALFAVMPGFLVLRSCGYKRHHNNSPLARAWGAWFSAVPMAQCVHHSGVDVRQGFSTGGAVARVE